MIHIEKTRVFGFEYAGRGMRNPKNSWDKSSSQGEDLCESDLELMKVLSQSGSEHSKYRRMLIVYLDIVAPLYWWKEFDTYKVGTVSNSCSTMHKIHEKKFELEDFSHENLISEWSDDTCASFLVNEEVVPLSPICILNHIVEDLNNNRLAFLETGDKQFWWQMIQLLPASYNQKRTVMLNYEVLAQMYKQRNNHKLDEWQIFCDWIETLPHHEIIV